MNWREWLQEVKWPLVLFWSLCLLVLLWGGQRLYFTHSIQRPAVAEIKQLVGVDEVTLQKNRIQLKLNSKANLKDTAQNLTKIAEEFLEPQITIVIEDGRDETLIRLQEEISLSLAQAVSRGEYETMRPNWCAAAKKAGAGIQVALGQDALYVTLRRGGSYLFEVIPRQDRALNDAEALPKFESVGREFS